MPLPKSTLGTVFALYVRGAGMSTTVVGDVEGALALAAALLWTGCGRQASTKSDGLSPAPIAKRGAAPPSTPKLSVAALDDAYDYRCTAPLGQRISMEAADFSAPRPK